MLEDIAPGADGRRRPARSTNNGFNGQALSERVVGPHDFDGGAARARPSSGSSSGARSSTSSRSTRSPGFSGSLPGDSPAARLGQRPGRAGRDRGRSRCAARRNVLYEVPLPFTVHGSTAFTGDLLRSNARRRRAPTFFSKDPWTISFGIGDGHDGLPAAPVRGHADAGAPRARGMGFGGDIGSLAGDHPESRRAGSAATPRPTAATRSQDGAPGRSRCATCGPATGSSSPTWPAVRSTSSRTPRAGSTRPPDRSRSSSSTSARTASGSSSRSRSKATVE